MIERWSTRDEFGRVEGLSACVLQTALAMSALGFGLAALDSVQGILRVNALAVAIIAGVATVLAFMSLEMRPRIGQTNRDLERVIRKKRRYGRAALLLLVLNLHGTALLLVAWRSFFTD